MILGGKKQNKTPQVLLSPQPRQHLPSPGSPSPTGVSPDAFWAQAYAHLASVFIRPPLRPSYSSPPGGGGGAVHLLCPVLESQAHLFPLEVTHFLTSLLKRPLLIILHASTCFPLERVSNA